MRKLFLAVFLACMIQVAQAQTQLLSARRQGETLKQFASRLIPKGARLDHVVEGDFGRSRGNVVVFFEAETPDGFFLDGWALVPERGGFRKHKLSGDYVRLAQVKSIFFADADGDGERELVVLTAYPSEDPHPDIHGNEVCDPYVFRWNGSGFARVDGATEYLSENPRDCTAAWARQLLSQRAGASTASRRTSSTARPDAAAQNSSARAGVTSGAAATPEEAAQSLYRAWRAKDRRAALAVATPAAVKELFEVKFIAMQAQPCGNTRGEFDCGFSFDAGEMTMIVTGNVSAGYRVKTVVWGAD